MSGEARTDQAKTPTSSPSGVGRVLSAAAWAICGLLLLLAATTWLPAGQSGSVQKLIHLASPLLLAVTAIGVALAAIVLVQGVTLLPFRARLLLGSLFVLAALYAVAALAQAWSRGEPYAALLSGTALWRALPWWLQGPAIGGLVLLPLAVIVHFVLSVRRAGLGGLVRWRAQQPVAMALVFAMVLSTWPGSLVTSSPSIIASPGAGAAAPVAGDAGAAGAPARPVPAPSVPLEQWRAEVFKNQDPQQVWQRYAKAATEELKRPGVDPSDVDGKAAALGRDRDRIFAFLRDTITAEPYSGELRGARGTLVAEAGNALDRALLGQALLKASGIESRLVSGKLPESQAQGLLVRYMATPPLSGPLASATASDDATALEAAAQNLSAKIGVPAGQIEELLRRAHAGDQSFWTQVATRRTAQYEELAARLRQAGVQSTAASIMPRLVQRFQEHWWLQVKEQDGTWSEFDPGVADARPGTAYGSAPVVRTKVPAELRHRFEISLVYRTTAGGKPSSQELLKGGVAAADALFESLEFRIQPEKLAVDTNAVLQMNAAQKIDLLKQIKRFQGVLRAGSQITASRVFDLEGNTFDAPGANPMASPGGLMGGMLGFGDEGGGGAFLDVQVMLRTTGPGRSPTTQTRTIVRSADVASPSFAPPLVEWSILVQPQWVSGTFVGAQLLRLVLALGEAATAARQSASAGQSAEPPPAIPQQLLQLAMLRERATAGMLAGQPNLHALVDEPMVTIAAHQLRAIQPQEGRIVGRRAIDIVTNRVRFVGPEDTALANAFDAAVRQGVADCALEQALIEHDYPQMVTQSGSTIFQRAASEGRAPIVVRANDTARLAGAGLPASDLEWIRASEAPGTTLVAAATADGSAAWWSIGPDGAAVFRVSGGGGQAHAEHELDLMYVSLKIMFALLCVVEVAEGLHKGPSAELGWKIFFCTVAAGASLGFIVSGWHAASWVLFGVEALEASLAKAVFD